MFFLILVIGVSIGLIAAIVINRYTTNETLASTLTVFFIAAAMCLSKTYVVHYSLAATYAYSLKINDPVCRLIAKTYPEQFNAFIENVKPTIRENTSKDTEFYFKIDLINTIFNLTALKATDDSIYDYYRSQVALYQELFRLDPGLVVFTEFSGLFKKQLNPNLAILLSGEDRVKDMTAKKEAVILSAIKTPQPPLTAAEKERATQLLHAIFEKLNAKFGSALLAKIIADPTSPTLNNEQTALFIIGYYKEILNLPRTDVGLIFKAFYRPLS